MISTLTTTALLLGVVGAAPEDAPGWVRPSPAELTKVFGLRWAVQLAEPTVLTLQPEEWSAPYVTRDRALVIAATGAGLLEARAMSTGDVVWRKPSLGALGAAMSEVRGRVLVSSGSNLLALDVDDGDERWRLDLQGGGVGGGIVVTGTVAIVPVRSNTYLAIDAVKGSVLWRAKRPTPDGITMRGQATPAIDVAAGRVYVGFSDGVLSALSLATGEVSWSATLGKAALAFADIDAEPVLVDGGRAVMAASYSGGLFGLDAASGKVLWKRDALARITGLSRGGATGLVLASHADGQVLGLTEDGTVRWRYRLKHGAPTDAVYLGRGLVAVGSTEGPLAFLDERTGKPRQLIGTAAGLSVAPSWRDPELALFTNEGMLVALRFGRGSGIAPAR
jgi:outer membrane protein assembly factor BamB